MILAALVTCWRQFWPSNFRFYLETNSGEVDGFIFGALGGELRKNKERKHDNKKQGKEIPIVTKNPNFPKTVLFILIV
jgi:hypothetical protein